MDRVNLPKLYATGEFSDCTFISSSGEEFPAHRFLFASYPVLKDLIAHDARVQLSESTETVERLLRWVYGVEWMATESVQPTRIGVGKELGDVMGVCAAAEKYEIPKLADDAYAAAGRVLGHITTSEVGLRVLKDLTEKDSAAGVLQRTVIDRVLDLFPKEGSRQGKRRSGSSRVATPAEALEADAEDLPEVVRVPKRSTRAKKPTAKAKEPPRTKTLSTKKATIAPEQKLPTLHCVCNKPEDPYLVECEICGRWFHPGCIGKGKYAKSTYKGNRRYALKGDEKKFREENLSFSCTECDELA